MIRRVVGVAVFVACAVAMPSGCATNMTFQDSLPKRSVMKTPGWEIRSDIKISKASKDALQDELNELRSRVASTLDLPPARRDVVVYLFKDEERYAEYMTENYPELPSRRAFFIGSPYESAVYAYWGNRTDEDLRHECTHGILHASLGEVPLWLDEGLAEYFEVDPADPEHINKEHAQRIAQAINNGWRPDLDRLAKLETVGEMQRADYQEAWAWVHFLLHESAQGRDILLETLHGLNGKPEDQVSLADAVRTRMGEPATVRMTSYITGVIGPAVWASANRETIPF